MESLQKLETSNPVKSGRHLRNPDHGHRLVEVQESNANIDKIKRKGARKSATELNLADRYARPGKTVLLFEE